MTEPLTLAQRLLAGLKGVTPGPWKHYYAPLRAGMSTINEVQTDKHREPIVQWAGFDNSARPKAQHKRNAAHIARCSPENIRALAEAVISQSATVARLSAELARARAERNRAALVAADEANRADAAEAAIAGKE